MIIFEHFAIVCVDMHRKRKETLTGGVENQETRQQLQMGVLTFAEMSVHFRSVFDMIFENGFWTGCCSRFRTSVLFMVKSSIFVKLDGRTKSMQRFCVQLLDTFVREYSRSWPS